MLVQLVRDAQTISPSVRVARIAMVVPLQDGVITKCVSASRTYSVQNGDRSRRQLLGVQGQALTGTEHRGSTRT